MTMRESNIVCRLKAIIDAGDKVLLFNSTNLEMLDLLRDIIKGRNDAHYTIFQSVEKSFDYVSQSEMGDILDLYRTYDFSDRVFVVSDSNQYGSLYNYVKMGILTKEEMIKALLDIT